jgi:hypothetical protein
VVAECIERADVDGDLACAFGGVGVQQRAVGRGVAWCSR